MPKIISLYFNTLNSPTIEIVPFGTNIFRHICSKWDRCRDFVQKGTKRGTQQFQPELVFPVVCSERRGWPRDIYHIRSLHRFFWKRLETKGLALSTGSIVHRTDSLGKLQLMGLILAGHKYSPAPRIHFQNQTYTLSGPTLAIGSFGKKSPCYRQILHNAV